MIGTRQIRGWLAISGLWALVGLVSWVRAAFGRQMPMDSSALFGIGLFILAISAILRLPAVSPNAPTRRSYDHAAWLLGVGANVNWLGVLALHSQSVVPVLLLVLVAFTLEVWLVRKGRDNAHLRWVMFHQSLPADDQATSATLQAVEVKSPFQDTSWLGNESATGVAIGRSADSPAMVRRTLEDGVDETGHRYLAGEVRTHWDEGQKSQTIVIGFTPAFHSEPAVETEVDSPEFSVRCPNCTQTGVRLIVKRSSNLVAMDSTLAWHARELISRADDQLVKFPASENSRISKLP